MLVSLPAEPILDHEVVALDPAQPAQHLPDYFGLPFTGDAVPWREKSDARGFPACCASAACGAASSDMSDTSAVRRVITARGHGRC